MKTFLRLALLVSVLAFVLVSAVFAGSLTLSGALTPGGPTEPVVATITTPNCNGSSVVFSVLYAAYSFTVDAAGVYTFAEPGTESAVYVYSGGFDPANPVQNCVAASNTNPINLSYALTAGTVYQVVVIEDTFVQDGMAYSLSITGPGTVSLVGGDCPNPLPAGSTVYSVPAGAPTFYAASLDTQTDFDLPAGTWYISGFEGDFAKVWIACQADPVYIPANAVAH